MNNRAEQNKIINEAIRKTRGRRILQGSKIGIVGVKGFFIAQYVDGKIIQVQVENKLITTGKYTACRIDILKKAIKELDVNKIVPC